MASAIATINVMIQGLFFLERKKKGKTNILEITAPALSDHHFLGGVRGNLVRLDGRKINWTRVGLKGGSPKRPRPGCKIPGDVKLTIPQFDRNVTNTGDIVGKWKGKILLPWPIQFSTLRQGAFPTYKSRTKKKPEETQVGRNVEFHCYKDKNSKLGVVTVLRYEYALALPSLAAWKPTLNFHFYFQPPKGHDIDDVNRDLCKASNLFANPDEFEVQIDKQSPAGSVIVPIGQGPYLLGMGPEDELGIDEHIQLVPERERSKTVPISGSANCPHFYVGP